MTRAQVALVRSGRILLACHRRKSCCYWVLPGGSIENGESAEEAAIRETREETGLEIDKLELLFIDGPGEVGGVSIVQPRFTYRGEIVGGALRWIEEPDGGNEEKGHLAGAAWMPFESAEYDAATSDTLARVRVALAAIGQESSPEA